MVDNLETAKYPSVVRLNSFQIVQIIATFCAGMPKLGLTALSGTVIAAVSCFVFLSGASRAAGISVRSVGIPDIRFTDETYRKYVGKRDKQTPWRSGVDVLTKRGYTMTAVKAAVEEGSITTPMGPMSLSADTPFVLTDFHQAYGLDTIWPYCESISKCLVYVQQDSPASKAPVTLSLPPGASAIDFYIDAAIDCVKTMRALVKCKALVQPGGVEVKFKVSSICASPFVGKYIGFFDESGDSIESVTLTCKSTAPTALGLVRIGSKPQQKRVQQAAPMAGAPAAA